MKTGEIVGVGDAYAQTVQVIKNIENALKALGATLENVVRTRMFVTDISRLGRIRQSARRIFQRDYAGDDDGRSFAL